MSRISGLFVVIALVAACSGAGNSPAAGTAGASGSGAAGGATVSLATTSLGQVLVGSNGKTLYGFTPDQAGGKPTCNGACATTWPPLAVTGDFTVGTGLDKSKFKLVKRDDGSQQLQVGSFPLYFYAPDLKAGDVNGQGVGGKWFVIGADGQLIQTGGSPSASPS
jgi:predicted lipoprotein with Yx(FWY)xxD motif